MQTFMKNILSKLTLFFLLFASFNAEAQFAVHAILPSATDAAITTFTDPGTGQYHISAVNQGVSPRNLLFVFLPGTGGIPFGYKRIDSLAADMGYHVIGLMYPNSPSVGSLCDYNSDSLCFDNVRHEIVDGIDRSSLVSVDTTNCIEHRLRKLIQYLLLHYSAENWGQYLDNTNHIRWDKIVISGHSQGGGHAGIIAKYYQVNRVVFFASPKDYNKYYNRQAAWYKSSHLTPTNVYYGFSHTEDSTGSTFAEQFGCYQLLGMAAYGATVNADTASSPYNFSHMLTSSLPTSNAHGCVVVDGSDSLDINGVPIYKPVWTYMLINTVITGINDNQAVNHEMIIWPNPSNQTINIECQNGYQIFSANGVLLKEQKGITTQIDISDLPAGLYFLKADERTARFIKTE
jgi:hypothetical protein